MYLLAPNISDKVHSKRKIGEFVERSRLKNGANVKTLSTSKDITKLMISYLERRCRTLQSNRQRRRIEITTCRGSLSPFGKP